MKVRWLLVSLVAVASFSVAIASPAEETPAPRYERTEPDIPTATFAPVPPYEPTTYPDSDLPHIDIHHDDDGESWFCRRHWYC